VIESRVVWKDLGSRRIGKSLEMELGLGDDIKRHRFLMVYMVCTCIVEIKSMTSGHMWEA